MKRRFYKELWGVRFNKMLDLEEKSVVNYQALLDECKSHFRHHSIVAHLERLIIDEKKHAVLVRELIKILDRQVG